MRTTVDIDAGLLKRLRVEARRRGVSIKELLGTLLRRGLEERAPARVPYRCPAFAMGEPLTGLDKAMQLAARLEDEETARDLALRK